MKHLHSFQSSAMKRRHWGVRWTGRDFLGGMCRLWQPASSAGWWVCSVPPLAAQHNSLCVRAGSPQLLVMLSCCFRPCAETTALPELPSCLGSVTQAFIALSAHGTQAPVQPVLHHVPSSGVAALERALDHNPAWPPSSITTNLFLHPVPAYLICSYPINQPSPVSCMEGWYLRSLLHHNALRHNYTPLKCTQHLLHHERCTKNMIREG